MIWHVRQAPSMAQVQGAVMVADITGFTKLTERLSRQGTAGVELLTKCINKYFTRVSWQILVAGKCPSRHSGGLWPCNRRKVQEPLWECLPAHWQLLGLRLAPELVGSG